MDMTSPNPITEIKKATGYSNEQLSIVSGLTVTEITRLESGDVIDPAAVARLCAAMGVEPAALLDGVTS